MTTTIDTARRSWRAFGAPMPTHAIGLGLRQDFADALLAHPSAALDFVEISPENYLGVGGTRARRLAMAQARWPLLSHGLTDDCAGAAALRTDELALLKTFLRVARVPFHSAHLAFTHVAGTETHDLLPLPHTDECIRRVATRVRQLADTLEVPIALENISAYARLPNAECDEATFVSRVLEEANGQLLLDINNVFVNANNFGFDADTYIDALPLARVVEVHVAGHDVQPDGLIIDSHAAPVPDAVLALLLRTLPKLHRAGVVPPILLERDHNIPSLDALLVEVQHLRQRVNGAPHANA